MTASSPETPVRIVDGYRHQGDRLTRVIGTTDIDGRGIDYAIADVGPFVLIDDARRLAGPDLPPFGAHPHAGIVAVSYVAGGGPWRARSNAAGFEDIAFGARSVLVTCAGRGVVHDERSVGDGDHEMAQIILRLPRAHRRVAPSVVALEPVALGDGVTRLFGPDDLSHLGLDAAAYHCELESGGRVSLGAGPSHTAGFVYARAGAVRVGDHVVAGGRVAVWSSGGGEVELATVDGAADALVGTGAPLDEPWVKLLGHNGFVIGADRAEVEAIVARYEDERERFGQAD